MDFAAFEFVAPHTPPTIGGVQILCSSGRDLDPNAKEQLKTWGLRIKYVTLPGQRQVTFVLTLTDGTRAAITAERHQQRKALVDYQKRLAQAVPWS